MNTPRRQRGAVGVGILMALSVVAVVVAIAVKHSWNSDLDITRAGHRWMGIQAKAYSEGAEQLAVIALRKDAEETQVDSLDELWATGFDFPTDHGHMRIDIVDAQSRLNLNALGEPFKTSANGQVYNDHRKYSATQRRFIRLLQAVPIDEDTYIEQAQAEAILEAVKDWVDSDDRSEGFGGAEASYYAQLDPPLTIADGPMVSVSELSRVKGVTPEIYRAVVPYVSALADTAKLNVNTIGVILARTIAKPEQLYPLPLLEAETLIQDIAANVPESVDGFVNLPIIDTLVGQNKNNQIDLDSDGLDVVTSYFELDTTVAVGDHIRRSRSLIVRNSDGVRVVRRSDAKF